MPAMARKKPLESLLIPPTLLDPRLASAAVKESAQQIWLAGMGAFSQAQARGGQAFEALVKEGMSWQQQAQATAQEKLGEVRDTVAGLAQQGAGAKAGLEGIFEERVARALSRLGIPSVAALQALQAQVDALTAEVGRLKAASAPAPGRKRLAAAPEPEPARKTSARRKKTAP
jgi:poly(hydroxyalkanoate) granule-associated protein